MKMKLRFSVLTLLLWQSLSAQQIVHITAAGKLPEGIEVIRRISTDKYIARYHYDSPDLENATKLTIEEVPRHWKFAKSIHRMDPITESKFLLKVENLEEYLGAEQVAIKTLSLIPQHNIVIVNAKKSDLVSELENDDNIVFVDVMRDPGEIREESIIRAHDLTVNSINVVHGIYPDLKGSGFTVSVKEKSISPDDIDVIERTFSTQYSDPEISQHATDMATLVGGTGNSSVSGLGVARDVVLTSADFSSLFPEPSSYYQQTETTVQNHSYGVGIENYYSLESEAYDQMTNENRYLVHVFSAGNAGNESADEGIYKDLTGYSNITGSFKQSKNSLTVTASNEILEVSASNSKGPAYDGRVKPELTAFGGDGTSDAAALVSGASVLIQNRYQNLHGKIPWSSTVKSVLIASAKDIGEKNVDYQTGYGSLDLQKSIQVVDQNSIFQDSIESLGKWESVVTIEENTHQIRIALAWIDPAANPGDFKALVNDLDLEVEEASTGRIWRPWVLNSIPHPDSLSKPAIRGVDNINNTELITIETPDPGDYIVRVVTTSNLNGQSQSFSIASHIIPEDSFEWISPFGGQPIESGTQLVARWNESLGNTQARLEIQYGGTPWQVLENTLDIDKGFSKAALKDTITIAQLRIVTGDSTYYSDKFQLSPVAKQSVALDCPDDLQINWSYIADASEYEIAFLAGKTMSAALTTIDTVALFKKDSLQGTFFAVTPIFGGSPGIRSIAIDYTAQNAGCYIKSFFATLNQEKDVELELELGSTLNVEKVVFNKISPGNPQILAETSATSGTLNYVFKDTNPSQGFSEYRASVVLLQDETLDSESASIFYTGKSGFLLYPNPVRKGDDFTILSSEADTYLEIVDSTGKIIFQTEIRGVQGVYNTINLDTGIYLYNLRKGDEMLFSQRFIVL